MKKTCSIILLILIAAVAVQAQEAASRPGKLKEGMGYGQTNSSNHCDIGGTVASSDNSRISSTYSGWIDLFGWGTGSNPTKSSESYGDYSTFTDWGINPIRNGGNQANMWRTLTKEEWVYMFVKRPNAKKKVWCSEGEWRNGCRFIARLLDITERLRIYGGYD